MLQSLSLTSFRSHDALQIDFSPTCTVIIGPNASGKTSIIEAIHLLANGSSFRAGKVEEMVAFGAEWARITGTLEHDSEPTELSVLLTRGILQGKKTQSKHFSINGVNKRLKSILGQLQTAVFRPEDLRIVEGSPTRRRKFLDEVMGSFDSEYLRSLKVYEQSLRRYNKLLEFVRERQQPRTVLAYWERSLVKHGEYVQQQRQDFFSATKQVSFAVQFEGKYQPSAMTEDRLDHYRDRAIAAGYSLIGPHKDDFEVHCDVEDLWRGKLTQFHNVALYGSRGQQRLAVLWLKACQLAYVEQQTNQRPVLLLDDIFSELDAENRDVVLGLIHHHQAIVTSADHSVVTVLPKQSTVIELPI